MAIDADLIHRCADASLKPAIVEAFIKAGGSTDPLEVTVRSGNRIVLVPPAKTPEEALATIRAYVGRAMVRVGVTQYPVGLGIENPSEISPDLLDACSNLRQGTALFGKVWRIVLKWYGNPTDESVMPQVLDDAIEAWSTGRFEGTVVFTAHDPGEPRPADTSRADVSASATNAPPPAQQESTTGDPDKAAIRVDLSEIGGPAH